jgi:hypothetical protein
VRIKVSDAVMMMMIDNDGDGENKEQVDNFVSCAESHFDNKKIVPRDKCILQPMYFILLQCHYYRHNATQSYIYTLPSPSQHVSASVCHLQVLAPTPKLPHCIE